jgi:hypothetical protein
MGGPPKRAPLPAYAEEERMKEIEIPWMGEVVRALEKWFLGPIRDLSGFPNVPVSIPDVFVPYVPVLPVAPEAPWIITTTPGTGQTPWYGQGTNGGYGRMNVYTTDTACSPDLTYAIDFTEA